ncbi:hypothetical protein Ciccas_012819, partial [Cichlidogyrus casuarinus]
MALNKVLKNFEEVSKHSEFLNLSIENFIVLLESDQLNVRKESSLLDVITRWVDYDRAGRLCDCSQLLVTIRLGMLTSEEVDHMKSFALVHNQTFYSELLSMWPVTTTTQLISQARIDRLNTPRLPCSRGNR